MGNVQPYVDDVDTHLGKAMIAPILNCERNKGIDYIRHSMVGLVSRRLRTLNKARHLTFRLPFLSLKNASKRVHPTKTNMTKCQSFQL